VVLAVGEEEEWRWFTEDAVGCSSSFSVFSFCLSSIFFSLSLCFYVLLLFSGSGDAASGSIVAVGDGSRRGMVLPLYAETPDSVFFSSPSSIFVYSSLFSLVLSFWSLFLFLSSFILCFKTNHPLLFFNSPL